MHLLAQSTLRRLLAPTFLLFGMTLLCSCASTAEQEPNGTSVPGRAPVEVRETVNKELANIFDPIDEQSELLNPRYR